MKFYRDGLTKAQVKSINLELGKIRKRVVVEMEDESINKKAEKGKTTPLIPSQMLPIPSQMLRRSIRETVQVVDDSTQDTNNNTTELKGKDAGNDSDVSHDAINSLCNEKKQKTVWHE